MTIVAAGSFHIPADHPCLPGHFPGAPLVPGVVLLDEALALVAAGLGLPDASPVAVGSAKFLLPVAPEDPVEVGYTAHGAGRIGFSCQVRGVAVLQGTARLADPA